MNVQWIAFGISFAVFIFVIDLIRREKLTFKYAMAWICISFLGMFFSIFDNAVFSLAHILGFELPSNFIFFTLLCVFVFMSLFLTIFLCKQSKQNELMAQKMGLMECELEELKK